MPHPAADKVYDPIDLSADDFWAATPEGREARFAELRAKRPVTWQRPIPSPLLPDESPGYWAVVRLADMVTVSQRADVFSSATGGVTFEDFPAEVLEAASSILAMDAPRHHHVRRVIASVFTPKRVALIKDQIHHQARVIVDGIADIHEDVELVRHVSSRLPMWTVSEMIGIPDDLREEVTSAANAMIGWDDEENIAGSDSLTVMFNGIMTLHGRCQEVIEARRAKPENDLITALVNAEADGDKLTDEEIRSFFSLLCVAGNDTTKQTTTHAVRALTQFGDQRRYLFDDFGARIDTAIEELVRWATPVMTFRRTALEQFELGGATIEPGDRVVMFYSSGNRDEEWFTDPNTLDLSRKPNPHVGFGARGPHFCLGSHVARMQLKAIIGELYRRLPDLEAVGEPDYLQSNFIHGIKRQMIRFTPQPR
jgi:cytochrome P450